MRVLKILPVALALVAVPLSAAAQQPMNLTQIVDKIVSQEQAEVQSLRQYSPIAETYIQKFRPDKDLGAVPDGDKYFLGRADLAKGVELEPLTSVNGIKHKMLASLENSFSTEVLASGFLQMIYVDTSGFDRHHYKFEYLRREFLGEVRCMVFDVDPIANRDKGRFVGRIWVEDQDYQIVRFNGSYSGSSKTSFYFNFDSWRVNAGKNRWLPGFIYSELDANNSRTMGYTFKAQTRLWGYALGHSREEQEMSKVLVEGPTPVNDQADIVNDDSPLQAERSWGHQAEDNVAAQLERLGLMARYGDVDKLLETVVNNLEVTNNLDIQPEVRCRVLMTSTLEAFTMGHTIVLSRGLVDVLPDEASLAAILAHELGHVVLGHRMDTQFAFTNRLRLDERETFHHFDFARTPEEEQAANKKGIELLKNSPYKDKLETAQHFVQVLHNRSKDIPNLISPHLGDSVLASWIITSATPSEQPAAAKPAAKVIAALPLGGRIKIEPWNDQLRMLKSKPVGTVPEYEKMPFEVTPFALNLTRQGDSSSTDPGGAVSANSEADANKPDTKP
jgi:peptidase M48-like protein